MFNKDHSGMINVDEFQHLYKFVNQWLQTFRSFDKDQSGVIEEPEVSQAFQQMGYRFSNEFIRFLIEKADKVSKKHISVDQFILICIQIQRFTGMIPIFFLDFQNHHNYVSHLKSFRSLRQNLKFECRLELKFFNTNYLILF